MDGLSLSERIVMKTVYSVVVIGFIVESSKCEVPTRGIYHVAPRLLRTGPGSLIYALAYRLSSPACSPTGPFNPDVASIIKTMTLAVTMRLAQWTRSYTDFLEVLFVIPRFLNSKTAKFSGHDSHLAWSLDRTSGVGAYYGENVWECMAIKRSEPWALDSTLGNFILIIIQSDQSNQNVLGPWIS